MEKFSAYGETPASWINFAVEILLVGIASNIIPFIAHTQVQLWFSRISGIRRCSCASILLYIPYILREKLQPASAFRTVAKPLLFFFSMKKGRPTQACKIYLILTPRGFRRQPRLSLIKVYFSFRN